MAPPVAKNARVPWKMVDADADVGAALAPLPPPFNPGVLGFDSAADPYFQWEPGTLVYVRATGRLLQVQEGGVSGRVAALIATLSASPGTQIDYVIAPASFGLIGTYPTLTGAGGAFTQAIADGVSNVKPAVFLVLPGTYAEVFAGADQLHAGYNIQGCGVLASIINGSMNCDPAFAPVPSAPITLSNLRINATTGSALNYNADKFQITINECVLSCGVAGFDTIDMIGAGAASSLTMTRSQVIQTGAGAERGINAAGGSAAQTLTDTIVSVSNLAAGARSVYFAGIADSATRCVFTGPIEFTNGTPELNDCRVAGGLADAGVVVVAPTVLAVRDVSIVEGAVGAGAMSGNGVVGIALGRLSVNGSVAATLTVTTTGPMGRCRYIQTISMVAAAVVSVNYGVDAVIVDPIVAGGTVQLPAANTMAEGWEMVVKSAPSAGLNSFTLSAVAGNASDNNATVLIGAWGSYTLMADRLNNRYLRTA